MTASCPLGQEAVVFGFSAEPPFFCATVVVCSCTGGCALVDQKIRKLRTRLDPTGQVAATQRRALGERPGLLPILVCTWAVGAATGFILPNCPLWAWLLGAVAFAALAGVAHVRALGQPIQLTFLLVVFGLLGATRSAIDNTPINSFGELISLADGRVLTVEGRLQAPPHSVELRVGRLEQFGYTPTTTKLTLHNARLFGAGASANPLEVPSIEVHVVGDLAELNALVTGDELHIRGRLMHSRPPSNPGWHPPHATRIWLSVPTAALVQLHTRDNSVSFWHWPKTLQVVEDWRFIVSQTLARALASHGSTSGRELVKTIVLGQRTNGFDALSDPFRKTGLAHYLAVSGFAFGVLIAMPSLFFLRSSIVIRCVVTIVVIALALAAIDVRAPAMRAGLVGAIAALGIGIDREWKRSSLLALAAFGLLLVSPRQLLSPGFQLSFVVVGSLLCLAPAVGSRLPGPIPSMDGRLSQQLLHAGRSAIACGVVAWASATPLVLHHFGLLSPLGVVLSVLAAPLVALIVFSAIGAVSLGLVWPQLAVVPGFIAAVAASALDSATAIAAGIPGAWFLVPTPSMFWVLVAELVIWRAVLAKRRTEVRVLIGVGLILLLWIAMPLPATKLSATMQLLSLDVGNGSAHVVRGPTGAVLFDAGSSSNYACAQRIIEPALRDLGVQQLDAVVITHANLDHFSAMGELVTRFRINRVVLGESFAVRASEDPTGAANAFLNMLAAWHVPTTTVSAGIH